jgi:hypothetical protein
MIEKTDIDTYINKNYDFLITTIKKTKNKYRPNGDFDVEEVLTDGYEHLLKNLNKLAKEKDIQAFFMRYITNQIVWSNSKLNKVQAKLSYVEYINSFDDTDDGSDLEEKINIEKEYIKQKTILFDFYSQIDNKKQKILYEVIFVKNIKTIKDLAKHFKINKMYLSKQRQELFADLKEYIKLNEGRYE